MIRSLRTELDYSRTEAHANAAHARARGDITYEHKQVVVVHEVTWLDLEQRAFRPSDIGPLLGRLSTGHKSSNGKLSISAKSPDDASDEPSKHRASTWHRCASVTDQSCGRTRAEAASDEWKNCDGQHKVVEAPSKPWDEASVHVNIVVSTSTRKFFVWGEQLHFHWFVAVLLHVTEPDILIRVVERVNTQVNQESQHNAE